MSKVADLINEVIIIATGLNKTPLLKGTLNQLIERLQSKPNFNDQERKAMITEFNRMLDGLTLKTIQWSGFGGKHDLTVPPAIDQIGQMRSLIEKAYPLAQEADTLKANEAALLERIQLLTNANEKLAIDNEKLANENKMLEMKAVNRKESKKQAIAAKGKTDEEIKFAQQQTIEAQQKALQTATDTSLQLVVANKYVFEAQQQVSNFFMKSQQLSLESGKSDQLKIEEVSDDEAVITIVCKDDVTKLLPKTKNDFLNKLLACFAKANDDETKASLAAFFRGILESPEKLLVDHKAEIATFNMPTLNRFMTSYDEATEANEEKILVEKMEASLKKMNANMDSAAYREAKFTEVIEMQKNKSATTSDEFNGFVKEAQVSVKRNVVKM